MNQKNLLAIAVTVIVICLTCYMLCTLSPAPCASTTTYPSDSTKVCVSDSVNVEVK